MMMISLFRVLFVTAFAGLLLLQSGCSDDPVAPSTMVNFSGELRWDKTPGFVGGSNIDTVSIQIEGNVFSYDLITNKGGFCNSGGRVIGFGTDSAEFFVESLRMLSCDTIRILRGKFGTVFRGDSLFMTGMLRDGIRKMDYDYRLVLGRPLPFPQ